MNNAQRKKFALALALARLSTVKDALEAAKEVATEMAEEEREKFNSMPEGLQQSERGQGLDEAATTLEAIAESLQQALDALEEAEGHDVP